MADISQIKLPNGDTFDLVDEKSGYITLPDLPVYDGTVVEDGDGYTVDVGYTCSVIPGETLFEETITTTQLDNDYRANFTYSTRLTEEIIVVTFNGTEYECSAVNLIEYGTGYGGCNSFSYPDFSEYPFLIVSSSSGNEIYTESAGTYTVKVQKGSRYATTTPCFEAAVKSVNSILALSMVNRIADPSSSTDYCILNRTWEDVQQAFFAGQTIYLYRTNDNDFTSYSSLICLNNIEEAIYFFDGDANSIEVDTVSSETAAEIPVLEPYIGYLYYIAGGLA